MVQASSSCLENELKWFELFAIRNRLPREMPVHGHKIHLKTHNRTKNSTSTK